MAKRATVRNLELEAAIIAAPTELAPRMVYGDWLQGQGDRRGEWAALQAGVEAAPSDTRLRSAAVAYLGANRTAILGKGAKVLAGAYLGWLGGFVDEIRLQQCNGATAANLRALFAHPSCRFVRHVALGELTQLPAAIAALTAEALPLCDSLVVHDAVSRVEPIDVSALAALPLRALALAAAFVTPPLPELRSFVYAATRLNPNVVEWLAAGNCANLEDLTLLHPRGYPKLSVDEMLGIVRALPKLRTLRAIGIEHADAFVAGLATLPHHISLLDLSHGDLSNDGRAALRTWSQPPELVELGKGTQAYRLDDRSWVVDRLRTLGRNGVRMLPGVGGVLYERGTNLILEGVDRALVAIPLLDASATLPSPHLGTYQLANAAIAHEVAHHLDEAELRAREALLASPGEPNFHAILIDAIRRTGRLAEAKQAAAIAEPTIYEPVENQHGGGQSACLLDCMITYAQTGDHKDVRRLARKHTKRMTPETYAVLAMSHVATGNLTAATAAMKLAKASKRPVLDHARAVMAAARGRIADAKKAVAKARADRYTEASWLDVDPNLATLVSEGAGSPRRSRRARGTVRRASRPPSRRRPRS